MLKDLKNFLPTNAYFVKVDMEAPKTYTTENGFEFYHPDNEGDIYQNKPFHGVLCNAPKNCIIPIGETVYMHYQSFDTATKIDGEWYYIIKDDAILGYGDINSIQAYKNILVEPIKEEVDKSKISVDVSVDELVNAVAASNKPKAFTSKAVVLSVSPEIDFVKVGDTIEYPKDLDWEFIVNRTVYFYIKWTHQIIRVNGELVNDYNEIVPQPANIEKFGLILPNTERFNECIEGKFEGKRILPDRKRIELSKYIKSQFIFGHLE